MEGIIFSVVLNPREHDYTLLFAPRWHKSILIGRIMVYGNFIKKSWRCVVPWIEKSIFRKSSVSLCWKYLPKSLTDRLQSYRVSSYSVVPQFVWSESVHQDCSVFWNFLENGFNFISFIICIIIVGTHQYVQLVFLQTFWQTCMKVSTAYVTERARGAKSRVVVPHGWLLNAFPINVATKFNPWSILCSFCFHVDIKKLRSYIKM